MEMVMIMDNVLIDIRTDIEMKLIYCLICQ